MGLADALKDMKVRQPHLWLHYGPKDANLQVVTGDHLGLQRFSRSHRLVSLEKMEVLEGEALYPIKSLSSLNPALLRLHPFFGQISTVL